MLVPPHELAKLMRKVVRNPTLETVKAHIGTMCLECDVGEAHDYGCKTARCPFEWDNKCWIGKLCQANVIVKQAYGWTVKEEGLAEFLFTCFQYLAKWDGAPKSLRDRLRALSTEETRRKDECYE